jgi:hypothetical protein
MTPLVVLLFFAFASSTKLSDKVAGSFGNVTFETSCTSVQTDFNTAVAVLHSFWYTHLARSSHLRYLKARELFNDILQKDPKCAIGYWGVAMTYWTPLW